MRGVEHTSREGCSLSGTCRGEDDVGYALYCVQDTEGRLAH